MISPNSIHLLYPLGERRCLVYEQLDELVWCAFACEKFELFVDGAAPGEDYACCDLGRRR